MNHHSPDNDHAGLEAVRAELKTIRRLLTGLLIGVGVLIGALIDPQISVLIAIAGIFVWILTLITGSILNRSKRRRYEAMRFRELSGRAVSANRTQVGQTEP